jgi:Translation-initiation factor 2
MCASASLCVERFFRMRIVLHCCCHRRRACFVSSVLKLSSAVLRAFDVIHTSSVALRSGTACPVPVARCDSSCAPLQVAKQEAKRARLAEMSGGSSVTLSTLATVDEGQEGLQRMNLIIKADATGTIEALKGALMGLPQDSVALRFLLSATGPVTQGDVDLAHTSKASIIAFNVSVQARRSPPSCCGVLVHQSIAFKFSVLRR